MKNDTAPCKGMIILPLQGVYSNHQYFSPGRCPGLIVYLAFSQKNTKLMGGQSAYTNKYISAKFYKIFKNINF